MENTETSNVNSPLSVLPITLRGKGINNQRFRWLFLIFLSISIYARTQSPDYRLIFGTDWEKAEQFVSENITWMGEKLERYNVDVCEAVAVIFPELVRYSALRDKMEITMLKALYVNVGEDYANFSIGQFQMKPSFAREIAGSLSYTAPGRLRRLIKTPDDFEDDYDYRSNVVADLEDVYKQLDYLILFLKICGHKYDTDRMSDQERIRFISTAYNYGLKSTREEIEKAAGKRFFSTKLFKSETYSYCDISLFWFNNRCPGMNNFKSKLP